MTRRNPPAKWALPDEIDPPERLCFMVPVPKNRQHIAAFRGALLELSRWFSWQEDEAHTAALVADVWKRVYQSVVVTNCVTYEPVKGMEIDDFMPLRVDCDCNVWVTCCDGTEMQLATVKMIQQPAQPTTNDRPAAGQSKEDCYSLQANGKLNLPYVVYPGDTLEITKATGAGNDGGDLIWRYANGDQMFGASDVGNPVYDGTDPLTTAYHMRLIYAVGNTPTYIDAMGGPVTISGSGPQQVVIQTNDSDVTNNPGSYQICVKITNNEQVKFTHTFDFTLSPGGFLSVVDSNNDLAQWESGIGWVYDTYGGHNGFFCHRIVPSRYYVKTTITLQFAGDVHTDATLYTPTGNVVLGSHNTGLQQFIINDTPHDWSDVGFAVSGVIASDGGSCVAISMTLEGYGTDPF